MRRHRIAAFDRVYRIRCQAGDNAGGGDGHARELFIRRVKINDHGRSQDVLHDRARLSFNDEPMHINIGVQLKLNFKTRPEDVRRFRRG